MENRDGRSVMANLDFNMVCWAYGSMVLCCSGTSGLQRKDCRQD